MVMVSNMKLHSVMGYHFERGVVKAENTGKAAQRPRHQPDIIPHQRASVGFYHLL
jgi:hypothetical protein